MSSQSPIFVAPPARQLIRLKQAIRTLGGLLDKKHNTDGEFLKMFEEVIQQAEKPVGDEPRKAQP